jgi:hypothetical protein
MDPLTNPFAVLTFLAAPAILTNASSVMALGTSNRFARTVDRARVLTKELGSAEGLPDDEVRRRVRQMRYARRRALLLVRALTTFYLSLGAFAAASLTSLLGAAFVMTGHEVARYFAMLAAFGCGAVGVAGLVAGASLLVYETWLTLRFLADEADLAIGALHLQPPGPGGGRESGEIRRGG